MLGRSIWFKSVAVALPILLLDASTKAYASGSYALGEKHEFLFLPIIHVQNPGISLALFSQLGLIDKGVELPIFVFAAAGALAAAGIFVKAVDSRYLWLPAGLALGGILGNVTDRIHHGYVTDFIYIGGLDASANVADFAIVLGMALFLLFDLAMLARSLGRRYRDAAAAARSSG